MKSLHAASLGLGLLFAVSAQAANVYSLTDSNTASIPDGAEYATVTLEDLGGGSVQFTVDPNDALFTTTGPNFGIATFAFNTTPYNAGLVVGDISLTAPAGGSVSNFQVNKNADGFGKFSYQFDVAPNGNPLIFTLPGVLADYVPPDEDAYWFAAHIIDLSFGGSTANSFWVQGPGKGEQQEVPLPGAVWLFGSALLGLVALGRRRFAA
jgi:hypothetical protein